MTPSPHTFTRHAQLPHLELRTATHAHDCYVPHTHEEYAFGAIDAGHAVYRYAQQQVALQPGMTVMMEPGLTHSCNPNPAQPWSYRMLYVNADWLHQSFLPFGSPNSLALAQHHSRAPAIYQALDAVLCALAQHPNPLEVDERLLLFLEHYALIPRSPSAIPRETHALAAVRDCIHAQPAQALTLTQLARLADMDGFQLIRKFKQHFGQTPHAYQIDVRLNQAKQLLKQGAALADVAYQMGFADQAHFQRQFKKRHATTPKNYLGRAPASAHG